MSCYAEAIHQAMIELSVDPKRLFIGYSTKIGRFGKSLEGIRDEQLIETPAAENLMVGLAIGLSIAGWKPVVCFQRFDFILNGLDAIVNHLDKMERISGGEFSPKVIIRAALGNKKGPVFTGETHTSDYTDALRSMVSFPVIDPASGDAILKAYRDYSERTVAVIESMDLM